QRERRLQRLPDVLRRDSGFRTHPDPEPGPARTVERLRIHGGGRENVGHRTRLGPRETLRPDADDLVARASQPEIPANHFRIAPKAPSPIVVAQYRERMAPGLHVIIRREQAAKGWLEPEDAEYVSGNVLPVEPLHFFGRAESRVLQIGVPDDH